MTPEELLRRFLAAPLTCHEDLLRLERELIAEQRQEFNEMHRQAERIMWMQQSGVSVADCHRELTGANDGA